MHSGLAGTSLHVVGLECSRCVDGGRQGKAEVRNEMDIESEGKMECGQVLLSGRHDRIWRRY